MTMGDRVAVMRNGLLQQVDTPQMLYEQPRNLFVAEFIGSPAMNSSSPSSPRRTTTCGHVSASIAYTSPTRRRRVIRASHGSRVAPSCWESGRRTWRMRRCCAKPLRTVDIGRLRHPRGHGLGGLRALQHRRAAGRDEGGPRGACRRRTRRRGDEGRRRAGARERCPVRRSARPRPARGSARSSSSRSTSDACTSSTRRAASASTPTSGSPTRCSRLAGPFETISGSGDSDGVGPSTSSFSEEYASARSPPDDRSPSNTSGPHSSSSTSCGARRTSGSRSRSRRCRRCSRRGVAS